jgi:hypothetical protein
MLYPKRREVSVRSFAILRSEAAVSPEFDEFRGPNQGTSVGSLYGSAFPLAKPELWRNTRRRLETLSELWTAMAL